MPITFGDDVLTERVFPTLHRWTLDLATGVVEEEQLDDRPGDFPRVNAHREGSANRYGYVAALDFTDHERHRDFAFTNRRRSFTSGQ